MKNFNELGLAEPVLRAVSAEGYTTPTPIQAQTIPVLMSGRDVIGIAQTGTGKTAAFVLPLLHRLAAAKGRPNAKSCKALVLAPTRELATQIAESIAAYGRHVRHRATVVVGGVRPGPQVRALAGGVDILVATPGRLIDHVQSGALRLDGTETVVLDEADQMLDLGFMPAIRRIMGMLPNKRQTVLFSATMPKQIRGLARDFLTDPAEIAVAAVSRPVEVIDQTVLPVEASAKRGVLVDLIRERDIGRGIVFTRTKHGANRVAQHLEKAGISSAAIHGNKSQNAREKALGAFRDGGVNILVATDIAARGIDVDDVTHVINFELPNVPEAYVHRIGRTARAGKSGVAISLCDGAERGLLRDIEKLIGRTLLDGPGAPKGGRPKAATPDNRGEKASAPRGGKPGRNRRKSGGRDGGRAKTPARPHNETFNTGDESVDAGLARMFAKIGQNKDRASARS